MRIVRLFAAELTRLARSRASFSVILAVASLLIVAYLTMGVTRPRLPVPERIAVADLLQFPEAHSSLMTVLLVFGAMFVAAYAGATGARQPTAGMAQDEAGAGGAVVGLLAFAALAVVLLLGLTMLYLGGLLVVIATDALTGPVPGAAIPRLAPGDIPGLLARGWLAATMIASIAFAAASATRNGRAGLVVIAGLFFAEQLVPLVAQGIEPTWGPLATAALLASADARQDLLNAVAVSMVYVGGSALVVALGVARARRDRHVAAR